VLLISVALHEFGHAIMADKLGDDTPRRQGRVTLNPLAHADPVGTIALPLFGSLFGAMSGFGGGFGWGKPVQWQPHKVSRRVSMSTAKVLVAVAGPAMNLLLAIVISAVHVGLLAQGVLHPGVGFSRVLLNAAMINMVLFFFNLLPIPPLDGGHVAQSFMPYRYRDQYDQIARFAPFALLLLMCVPRLQIVFAWPASKVVLLLHQGFGRLFGI
jgi:Zn-dependent protease